ncbi:MAG: PRTRC system ThiF family protein [Victivallales bacterium]|nr:PRTRC system ThiF family protein [Victivallales bacterium]
MNKKQYQANPKLSRNIDITLIGVGGTGSLVLSGLASISTALRRSGRTSDVNITAYDGDTVSSANIGRQPFMPAEIGQNKATALIHRLNLSGFNGKAEAQHFNGFSHYSNNMLIIGCVDSRRSRRTIKEHLHDYAGYYIDCGNDLHTGQVIIGCQDEKYKLPMPWDICPDLVSDAPEDDTPSCSLAEALNSQDLMVNRFCAVAALELIWQLLHENKLDSQGAFFDSKRIKMNPIPIQPSVISKQLSVKKGK